MTLAVEMSGVAKRFGAVVANRDASLRVAEGDIHALVGENGAGKSTLMRLLAGLHAPDAGTVKVSGRDVTGWNTREAIDAGVGMVHQHFMLVPTLTVAENLVLGQEPRDGWRLDSAAATRSVRALCERTGLTVDPDRLVSDLTVGEAQRVEMLKVLFRGAKILILDEPTAVLSPPEVSELWKVLRGLAAQGSTIVLITHKLDEVIAVSQRITVMRGGATVGEVATSESTPASIARLMVGRDVKLAMDSSASTTPISAPAAAPILRVTDLVVASSRRANEVDHISLEVQPGEILGIAGVEGNGQTELLECIAGLRRASSGRIELLGRDITQLSVRERVEAGISHVPEDRHRRGLIMDYSIADNLILGLQHTYSGRAALDRTRIRDNASARIAQFDIRPPHADAPVSTLSGGNQQKVVIARELRGRDFSLLLAVQPTRGVDVGAIEFIHQRLIEARDAGKAVLLVSADLVEVLALSDRVAVLYGGRVRVTMKRADASAAVLGPYMTGASTPAA
jgi:simple sugar transport system ATP-binding protein